MCAVYAAYMKAKETRENMESVSGRIPVQLYRKLDKLAQDTERDKSWHIRKALEAYLRGQK